MKIISGPARKLFPCSSKFARLPKTLNLICSRRQISVSYGSISIIVTSLGFISFFLVLLLTSAAFLEVITGYIHILVLFDVVEL